MTPVVIAEVGCNHRGELATAKRMIRVAAEFCEVDVVKFQKRCPRECLPKHLYDAPHPDASFAYGPTYGAHREALEFSADQHAELRDACDAARVQYSTSVWDVTSARDVMDLCGSMGAIKVPSACNLNRPLLELLAGEFRGEIHVSLGMTTRREEEQIVEFFAQRRRLADVVLYACVSGYPVPVEDLALLEVERLVLAYGDDISGVGFSGHHTGIAADVAAVTLGARYVERHFTLDRTWKGTDHAASLEPDGMRRVARDVRAVARGLRTKTREIEEIEVAQRAKLKEHQIDW